MVRRAESGDLELLTGLIAGFRDWWGKSEPGDVAIGETVEHLLRDPDTEFLLADDVGFCQLRYRLSVWTGVEDCWLEDLYVTDAARGKGYGRALVEAALDSARERGCRRIELDVNEENAGALALYLSSGFTLEPKPPGRTLFISRPL
jgi:GNAT superfamily N-acetyltransferase